MSLRLEVVGNGGQGVDLPAVGTLVVGSSRERAGFVVDGQGIDEAHCAIGRTKEGDWAVKDLGSRNGTVVNGQRVSTARLREGDQIVLGTRRLEVRPAGAARKPAESVKPADLPARIGGYRVERLIGRGGMGLVALAVQESLSRPVALKILASKLAADADFVRRFQAEARAAAALSHPNVVIVYDVGEANGSHYLSMEFMAGGSLEQKVAGGRPLPWRTVLSVLSDAAAGLAYAESRGIVHRDIKPANLMYSGTGTVKIADLGLATTLEQEANEAEGGRKVYGTPHFISPEQARGEAVDHRSDLYSLGATAYRLLTGHTPFEGATSRDILRALQTQEPQPLHELVPGLPPELEAVVTRLMEKDARQRFPSAESLRRECERLRLEAEHGTSLAGRKKASSTQRNVGVALLVVVGGATAAWYFLEREPGTKPNGVTGPAGTTADRPADSDEDAFFGSTRGAKTATDEEGALRALEREAQTALDSIPALASPFERTQALEGIAARFPGTAAATAARAELDAAKAAASGGPRPGLLDATVAELRVRAGWPPAENALPRAGAALTIVREYLPPLDLSSVFEPARKALEDEILSTSAAAAREGFERATASAKTGDFTGVRRELDALTVVFDGLDTVGGDPASLAELRAMGEELDRRRARVDEEERHFVTSAERQARLDLGRSLGPGSGLLGSLGACDWAGLEKRLEGLAPELRARPLARALTAEVGRARAAHALLVREFAQGTWRRKSVIDPRTHRVREVRDVRPEALVFDKDGALEEVPWSVAASDPDWWAELFEARLAREWDAAEKRSIASLLHLVGVARAGTLASQLVDPGGRGLLQPAELDALAAAFAPAQKWIAQSGDDAAKAELEAERRTATLLAAALRAAQERSWSAATAALERCLRDGAGSILVGVLSDGTEWELPPDAAAPSNGDPVQSDGTAKAPDKTGGSDGDGR